MDQELPEIPRVETIPVADIQIVAGDNNHVAVTRTFPVKQPESESKDFIIEVRASILERCRARLAQIGKEAIPWGEILLGISTSAAGAIAGAITAGIVLGSALGVLFYVVLPMIAVGALVAFIYHRRAPVQHAFEIAQEVLADLPDPDQTV